MKMKRGRGLVLGKFMPPHLGHLHLVEFARSWVDELVVVVGTLAREPIPGELRHRWMKELAPWAKVVHLTDENPQDPSEHPDFWEIWRASLKRVVPEPIDWVFASEAYGKKLAEILGAEFVPVDPTRTGVKISGTAIRSDPLAHWEYIPRCVRPYFVKRVSIFGPESTGKSTLARDLAALYETVAVPEYARTVIETRDESAPLDEAAFERIARGQVAAEEALARSANRVLFCDTDLLLTTIWSRELLGHCPDWLAAEAARHRYDLTLLTDVDVEWVSDPVRLLSPDTRERREFHGRCQFALEKAGRRFARIHGSGKRRLENAVEAIERHLAIRPPQRGGSSSSTA